jgi:hypothetical protein
MDHSEKENGTKSIMFVRELLKCGLSEIYIKGFKSDVSWAESYY